MWSGLQPCVVGAATVGTEAAALCDPGARHRGAGAEPLRRPRGDAAAAGACGRATRRPRGRTRPPAGRTILTVLTTVLTATTHFTSLHLQDALLTTTTHFTLVHVQDALGLHRRAYGEEVPHVNKAAVLSQLASLSLQVSSEQRAESPTQ